MTPCSPSGLPGISVRAALGIPTFRALFLPEIRRSFELTGAFLTLLDPKPTHASNGAGRTRRSSTVINPSRGDRVSRLQGLTLRESGPLQNGFRVLQRPMPSWFSSSPGSSPPCPPRNRRPSSAHALRPGLAPLAGSRPDLRLSVLPDSVVALSLSRLPTLSRFFPCAHPSLWKSLQRWVIDSPRGRRTVTGTPAPLFAPPGSLPELDGFGRQGRIRRPVSPNGDGR